MCVENKEMYNPVVKNQFLFLSKSSIQSYL